MNARIMIVDDDHHILKACARVLKGSTYRCYIFSSPIDALKQVTSINPSVVISDQRMPDMEGTSFLEKIKQVLPLAVRIMMTGYADVDAAVRSINKGHVFRFIKKPWDDDAFNTAIDHAMGYHGLKKKFRQLVENKKEEYSEQERFKGVIEMAGAVCHEFAQPLQVILGNCELIESLSKQNSENSIFNENIICITESINELSELLLKIMTINSYKTKNYAGSRKIVDIHAANKDGKERQDGIQW